MRNPPLIPRNPPLAALVGAGQDHAVMHRALIPVFAALATSAFASPPAEDREAILAMAGGFKVDFDFQETVSMVPDSEDASKPYHEEAHELVIVAEDTPERITLQHLLVVSGKSGKAHVIKHWAQVWTWQDTRLLDYAGSEGDDVWKSIRVSPEQAAGKWSQLVTSVDDTPRYEALGKWVHSHGESSWTGEPSRRPLPRREYEKRDDYDYLLAVNRHTITPQGWAHFQDNRKVVDRGEEPAVIAFETGLNRYSKEDHPSFATATAWWEEHSVVWNPVRNFWLQAGEKAEGEFSYRSTEDGVGLSKKFSEIEKTKPDSSAIAAALSPYVISQP